MPQTTVSRWMRIAVSMSAATFAATFAAPCMAAASVTASSLQALQDFGAAPLVLIGEQHDADAHQLTHAQAVQWLLGRGQLGALAVEMADAPHSTQGLPPDATDAQVRAALHWDDAGWPWQRYGPAVMQAVRAAVPVHGVNLARSSLRAAMADASLDKRLGAQALAAQQQEVRSGHCELLPESQIAPMTRVQVARDAQMAQSLARLAAAAPGKTVLLMAGTGHVRRDIGVPALLRAAGDVVQSQLANRLRVLWLVAGEGEPPAAALAEADRVLRTPALPPVDYCAELRERFRPRPPTP